MADLSAQNSSISIAQALQDLPQETPLQSAWPMLAQKIPAKKSHRYFPMALAASIALLAIIPMSRHSPQIIETQSDARLQPLMQQSLQLENFLIATRNSTSNNASAEVISLALEDRIHAIDSELGSASLTSAQQLSLWQQRVGTLQEATGLYSSQRYQQAEGRPFEIALVESF